MTTVELSKHKKRKKKKKGGRRTSAVDAQLRRVGALTIELVSRGELPAFYELPNPQLKLERTLQRKLAQAFSGFADKLFGGLEAGTISAGNEGAVVAALAEDVVGATAAVQAAYEGVYVESAFQSFNRESAQILDKAGIELDFKQVNTQARRILRDQSFQASKGLMDRVVGDVTRVLTKGFDQGLGSADIGRNLKSVVTGLRSKQGEIIARTEINSAGNIGSFLALETASVEYIQWISAQDLRVRDSHIAIHALVVKRGERFPNGLKHPGDKSGPIEEWIACRCAGVAYFPLQKELLQDPPYTGRA